LKANAYNMIDTDFSWPWVLGHLNNIYRQSLQLSIIP
jgi:hypothetical protein